MLSLFDHVFSYVGDNQLDATLARFERSGFLINPRPRPSACGRLNVFVSLTRSYLEFISVADETEFQRDAAFSDWVLSREPATVRRVASLLGAICFKGARAAGGTAETAAR